MRLVNSFTGELQMLNCWSQTEQDSTLTPSMVARNSVVNFATDIESNKSAVASLDCRTVCVCCVGADYMLAVIDSLGGPNDSQGAHRQFASSWHGVQRDL